MRRMLDPKEVGGGSTAPARHRFMITVSYDCWFLSFSTEDYGFEIGKEYIRPADFYTNDKYKDLRSTGMHPAGGYYNGDSSDLLVSTIYINPSSKYIVKGYKPSIKTSTGTEMNIQNKPTYIYRLS